jgi:hypothetical protein
MKHRRHDKQVAFHLVINHKGEAGHEISPEAFADLEVSFGVAADKLERRIAGGDERASESWLPLIVPGSSVQNFLASLRSELNAHRAAEPSVILVPPNRLAGRDPRHNVIACAPIPQGPERSPEAWLVATQGSPKPLQLVSSAPPVAAAVPGWSRLSSREHAFF